MLVGQLPASPGESRARPCSKAPWCVHTLAANDIAAPITVSRSSPLSTPARTEPITASPAPSVSSGFVLLASTCTRFPAVVAIIAPRGPSVTSTTCGPACNTYRARSSTPSWPSAVPEKQASQTLPNNGSQYSRGRSEKSKDTRVTAASSFSCISVRLQSPVCTQSKPEMYSRSASSRQIFDTPSPESVKSRSPSSSSMTE